MSGFKMERTKFFGRMYKGNNWTAPISWMVSTINSIIKISILEFEILIYKKIHDIDLIYGPG